MVAANDAPTAAVVSSTYSAPEQTARDLKGQLSVGDVDGGNGVETATLTVGEGTLTVTGGSSGASIGGSGTGNLGGFRSSCTSNLIPADGVLNAPDYTRTCVCAYQVQTSLAFVHMEDADSWTFNPAALTVFYSMQLPIRQLSADAS